VLKRHRSTVRLAPLHGPNPSPFPASNVTQPASRLSLRCAIALTVGIAIVATISCGEGRAQPKAIQRTTAVQRVDAPFSAFVAEASQRFGVPAVWIRAVMRAESFGAVHAISPKGAMGLMQIMPATWAGLRQRCRLGADPYDAHGNIIAGAAYLRELHDRYGAPGFLAAYNAGPARWEDQLATDRPLPMETQAYLARLAPVVGGDAPDDAAPLASVARSWTQASLFVARSIGSLIGGPPAQKEHQIAQKEQAQRLVSDGRLKDLTGPVPQSGGLFVALSPKGAVAMNNRALEGYRRELSVSEGRHVYPTHGRQDKSAAMRRAQMVGRVEVFGHPPRAAGWRFRHFSQHFQWPDRHPLSFPRAVGR
jgi:hypothetical protein